jgi:hypothetical protein
MIRARDNPTKLQKEGERRQLFFRKLAESDNTERIISSMNAARRSMGIAEIQ